MTAEDFIPILTFVPGEAQLIANYAVISLLHPRDDADGTSPPRPVFMGRLIKLSLHKSGDTFGLEDCREAGCLMGFSSV